MAKKTHAVIRNVRGGQLPAAWAKQLGLDMDVDSDRLIEVRLDVVAEPQTRTVSRENVRQAVARFQALPTLDPTYTEDSLYDEQGLPK